MHLVRSKRKVWSRSGGSCYLKGKKQHLYRWLGQMIFWNQFLVEYQSMPGDEIQRSCQKCSWVTLSTKPSSAQFPPVSVCSTSCTMPSASAVHTQEPTTPWSGTSCFSWAIAPSLTSDRRRPHHSGATRERPASSKASMTCTGRRTAPWRK